jgi:hypothetical protein
MSQIASDAKISSAMSNLGMTAPLPNLDDSQVLKAILVALGNVTSGGGGGGTGDVVGPASSTDSAVALWDGATGKLLKNSSVFITGGGTIGLGGFTLTVPATGTAALLGTANTFSLANAFSVAGATSTPAVKLSGAWKVATAATVAQMLLEDPTGSPTVFAGNAAGTGLGMNIKTFTGNYLDFQLNGISQFSLTKSLLTFQGAASSTHGMTISCDASGAVFQGLYNGSSSTRGAITLNGDSGACPKMIGGSSVFPACEFRTTNGAVNTTIEATYLTNTALDFTIRPAKKDYGGVYTGGGHTMTVAGGKASVSGTGGAGGAVNVTGGDAGSAGAAVNNNGGDVIVKGGAATGSGTIGAIKLGIASSQLIGLWNATPIIQPTTAIASSTFVANTSLIANDTGTWDGYTIGQVVKALRNLGILA